MARVDFYRLSRDPAEKVIPALADRLLKGGDRLLVVAASAMQRQEIDAALWSHQPASFLPHGAAESPDAAIDPILISGNFTNDPANGARHCALADGVWHDDALKFERVFLLFDQRGIDDARATWRLLKDADGVERHFWQQDDRGRWSEGP
jgi:DNA polymerase-3 subunit chi